MSTDPLIGTVIHGFRVEKQLREGGMGQVYIARHESLSSIHKVVKVLLPEFSRDEQIRTRFMREAKVAAAMDHPNVITVDNFGTLPSGELFLMMPLLTGRALDEYLQSAGKLGAHHALQIAAQVASALQHAHARGIIHRDLKPGNIFIERKTGKDTVKLLDFGIAKDANTRAATNARTRTGMSIGTPHYMACEQYGDAGAVTAAADIFALAIVVVEMLTGDVPWGTHPPDILYFLQRTEKPVFGPEVPRAWLPVLSAALAFEPANRPPTVSAFVTALAQSLDARPPLWPTGTEIVDAVAPDLVRHAQPQDATVRPSNNPIRLPVLKAPTTLSASNGAAFRQTSTPRPRFLALVLLGMLTTALVGGLVAFVAGAAHSKPRSLPSVPQVVPDAAPVAPAQPITPLAAPVDAGVVDAAIVSTHPAHGTPHRVVDAGVIDASVAAMPDAAAPRADVLEVRSDRGDLVSTPNSCGNDAEMAVERIVHGPLRISIEGSAMTLLFGGKRWTADRSSNSPSHAAGFFDQSNDVVIAVSVQRDDNTVEVTRFVRGSDETPKCSDTWRGQVRRIGL